MSVAYPVRSPRGPIPLSAGLFGSLRASQTPLSYLGFISRRGAPEPVGRVDSYRKNPSSACFVTFSGKTDGIGHCYSESRASTASSPIRLRFFSSCPLSPPLACPALTRSPARCFSCALRDFAALLFRFLPEEISRAQHNLSAASARSGRDFFRLLPKKRRSPLGAGHLASQAKGCPE